MGLEKVEAKSSNHQKLEYLLLLAEAQSSALSKTMNEINNFNVAARITTSEQLYYVKSPIHVKESEYVINRNKFTSRLFPSSSHGDNTVYQTKFTQSELDDLQMEMPAVNIEVLKVRVEDYDNAHR